MAADRSRLAAALAYKQAEEERRRRMLESIPTPAGTTPAQPAPQADFRTNLENLSIGLGEGLTNQLEGVRGLVTDPVGTAKGVYEAGKAVVRDPAIIASALRQMGQKAMSGPLGAGEVIGEMISPTRGVGGVVKRDIDKAIEGRYFQRLDKDFEGLKAEYATRPDSYGGKVLNTDVARELSPEYLADRTKSADVHEPSSTFIKKLYAERLAQPTPPNKDPVVIFTAGGTGAGKTSGMKKLREVNPNLDRAELEYDTNMNGYESSKKKVEQALESGRQVQVVFTYRDPVEALDQGALTRAMGQEAEFGSGRTVPLTEHLKTHIGARQTMEKLAKDYADNPNFNLVVIDNSRGKGNAAVSALENLPKLSENKVRDELRQALEKARNEKRISEKVYRGFADY